MTSFGPLELLIVIAIAALLFGAPVVTFILGYGLGQKKATAKKSSTQDAQAPDEGVAQDE